MKTRGLDIVVLGLSLSSSWGNGHATTYRALIDALARRGHDVLFLERDLPWYAQHRDLAHPAYCGLAFYDGIEDLERYRARVACADAVIVGSYVPDGIAVGKWVLEAARGLTAFYDIDTPVTLAAIDEGSCSYLTKAQIARYDVYLSFTGGPTLDRLRRLGARAPHALYCSADVDVFRPQLAARRWDLGYLGTYSSDRQPTLERLLIEPARRLPHLRLVVAGAQFPPTIEWPANVERICHLPPCSLPAFFSSLGWTLNVTRADMIRAGYSPSVRLFEAAACGTPLISDAWEGLDSLLTPGKEIIVARDTDDVLAALALPEARRREMSAAARAAIHAGHTSHHRAENLERCIENGLVRRRSAAREPTVVHGKYRNRSKLLTFSSRRPPP